MRLDLGAPVAIDVFAEEMVTMNEAATRLPRPRGGKPVSRSTLWRWTYGGLKAKDGQIIRLDTVRIGGTVYTSIEAMRSFFNRLQGHREAISTEALGGFLRSPDSSLGLQSQRRLTPEQQRRQQRVSLELDLALFGCDRLISECGVREETLLELFDRLCQKLPTTSRVSSKAYDIVRRSIFVRAIEVCQGVHGFPKGAKAAKAWIDSIDPALFDVSHLKGCGPRTTKDWNALVENGLLDKVRVAAEPCGQ